MEQEVRDFSCGDSSRVAAARWPSIQAHTQLSPAFLNPPGFSKMTLTWRMEPEALNSAEPGLQLFVSFMGSPRVAVTVLKWGALASEGCFRFLFTAPVVRKRRARLAMVTLPHVLSVNITLLRRVLPLLLVAKGLLPQSQPVRCALSHQSTGAALKLPGRFSYSHVTQNKAGARDAAWEKRPSHTAH